MEKTRDELMEEMIKNIQDQKNDTVLDEIAMPGVDMTFDNKKISKKDREERYSTR